jgi:hypothetical protein
MNDDSAHGTGVVLKAGEMAGKGFPVKDVLVDMPADDDEKLEHVGKGTEAATFPLCFPSGTAVDVGLLRHLVC